MKLQEIFDKVGVHLLMQGEASVHPNDGDEEGGCAYRGVGSNGQRTCCAVGALIADEHYTRALESRWCGTVTVKQALHRSGILDKFPDMYDDYSPEITLLSVLQKLHDSGEMEKNKNDFRKRMFAGLQVIAQDHGLEFNFEESDWIDE